MDDLCVDIPDARLRDRFGTAWFLDDPRVVAVVRECRDEQPVIQRYRYRNLNRRGLSVPFYKQFHLDPTMEYQCFYTGADVYITHGRLLGWGDQGAPMWQIPWALTREHVAPRRERDPNQVNTLGNMVPCALFVNRMMAHMPLAIKLYERDYLHRVPFDRHAMTYETALFVRSTIIAFERQFWFTENYPWFPHAYRDRQAKHAADEFFRHLWRHEETYLALPWREQQRYLRQPCDLDVSHLAKTVLGIDVATML